MIVVEGPDGGGKTTLIHQLVEELGLTLMPKFSTSIGGPHHQLSTLIEKDLSKLPERGQIYDRYPLLSEPIYGPIIRESAQWGWEDAEFYRSSWARFVLRNPLIIFCIPPYSTLRRNVTKESQMPGVVEFLPAIYWSYFFLSLRLEATRVPLSMRVMNYDYTNSRGVDEYQRVLHHIRENWRAQGWH